MEMTATHNQSLEQIDRDRVLHPMTKLAPFAEGTLGGPRIMEGGQGVRVRDTTGRTFIDAFAGLYCVNIGYGRAEVADAIARQAHQLAYYHSYAMTSNEPAIRLSDRLMRLAPAGMSKVFYGLSGSDANETQVKIVWYYNNVLDRPRKKKIISRLRGYHGATVMSGSLTGLPFYHTAFDLPVRPVIHTLAPHHYWNAEPGETEAAFSARCAAALERTILEEGPDTVAAFIAEPALGTGGLVPPPAGYWQAIQPVLRKYDVLLIADEVICGFGRTGAMFGCDRYGIAPDLITLAKGLTSAYAPLSAVLVGDRVWQVLAQGSDRFGPFAHGFTYTGHPLGTAAALANLDIVEGEDLAGNADATGRYLLQRMTETFADHPLVGEVRGDGLLCAVEFVADKMRKRRFDPALAVGARLSAAVLEDGVIARAMPQSDALGFAPPLCITPAEVDEVVERVKRGVDRAIDALTRDGLAAE